MFRRLCRRYAAHFTAVGVRGVLHTTARVDAALFNAVGMDIALPLYCGYGRYCPFTAAIMDAAFYTAVRVDAASFFSGCWWTLPLFIDVDADFIYCS